MTLTMMTYDEDDMMMDNASDDTRERLGQIRTE